MYRPDLSKIGYLHNDVINGDVNEFNEKSNKAHDCKTNCCGDGNLLKFCNGKINYFNVKTKSLNIYNMFF